MEYLVAVYLQDSGDMASFFESDKIVVFRRHAALWSQMTEFPIPKPKDATPAAQRSAARSVIRELGDCRIIAGHSLSGIVYSEFDRAGFHIFDLAAYAPEVFESIVEDIRQADAEGARAEAILAASRPTETGTPGVYQLDLTALQREYPQVSSKQALQDFLASTPFFELHLVCAHMPPWLENGIFDIRRQTAADGTVHAVLTKQVCGGGQDD